MDNRVLEDLKMYIGRFNCDICHTKKATHDAKTKFGPWAFMCPECFENLGVGFGMGKGYKFEQLEDINVLP